MLDLKNQARKLINDTISCLFKYVLSKITTAAFNSEKFLLQMFTFLPTYLLCSYSIEYTWMEQYNTDNGKPNP